MVSDDFQLENCLRNYKKQDDDDEFVEVMTPFLANAQSELATVETVCGLSRFNLVLDAHVAVAKIVIVRNSRRALNVSTGWSCNWLHEKTERLFRMFP